MFEVYTLPDRQPGVLTLQASPDEWTRVAAYIRAQRHNRDNPSLQMTYRTITRADMTGPAVRITFPEDQARAILRALGLAS